jgi:hypothetical protein
MERMILQWEQKGKSKEETEEKEKTKRKRILADVSLGSDFRARRRETDLVSSHSKVF